MKETLTVKYLNIDNHYDKYIFEHQDERTVIFVKSNVASTLDIVANHLGELYMGKNLDDANYYGLDLTEANRKNKFYRFFPAQGNHQTIESDNERLKIEGLISQCSK